MSGYIVPLLAILVLVLGLIKRVDVYAAFAEGAAEGVPLLFKILPYLAAMLTAIRMLRDSGALDTFTSFLTPFLARLGVDAALLPLILIRPFSGSAAIAIFQELLATHGPDAPVSRAAAILMGSSETIFYEVALYFGVIGVKKTRFAIPVAIAASFVSVVVSLVLAAISL